jgi:adenylate cyclase
VSDNAPIGSEASAIDTAAEEAWRAILTGEAPGLQRIRRSVGWIPAEPRCTLCAAPFGPPGNIFLRPFGFGPSRLNRRLCKKCLHQVGESPGGAEVEISMMFADVRGSTSLAERMPPQEFSRLGVALLRDGCGSWTGPTESSTSSSATRW